MILCRKARIEYGVGFVVGPKLGGTTFVICSRLATLLPID